MFRVKSLATKLLLVTGITIALLLVLSNFVLISQTRDRVRTLIDAQAETEARHIASEISAQTGALASAAKTMAGVLGRVHEGKSVDRKGAINLLRANLEQHEMAFGSWFAEEPKAFDGRQDDVKNNGELGGNEAGIFTPYWTKGQDGGIRYSTFAAKYGDEWYALAAKSLKGAITRPYMAEGTEVPTAMSSIAFPVVSAGKLIGVSGVDISLKMLSSALSQMHPFSTGRVMLVSQDGKWLVAPNADLLMKDYDGAGADVVKAAAANKLTARIDDLADADGSQFQRLAYPFELPELNATWVLLVDVPQTVLTGPVMSQTKMMVAGGVLLLLAVLVSLLYSVRTFVQKPIRSMIDDVSRLGSGDYETGVTGQARADETGEVARALDGLRVQLARTRELEATTESQRASAERERELTDTERTENARQQQYVVAALGSALEQLSEGNLAFRINSDFPGEYANLKTNYNRAVESLEEAVLLVNGAVSAINSGTTEISTSANDLSKRTEQQAAQLEETAAALNEITEQVHSSAENAKSASATVQAASTEAEKSGRIVESAIEAMGGIESSSAQIASIISVIDEIAFQTNLLALNAGVEAARAGDQGKGFAVVAQEVRELAQRSARAAKEIKTLIATSTTQVQNGVALVGQTGEALQAISSQVMQINSLIRMISVSASEQATGLKEMNSSMHHMDQVTQQNAAMVEETTAASMSLSEEADQLRQLVSRFRTSNNVPTRTGQSKSELSRRHA